MYLFFTRVTITDAAEQLQIFTFCSPYLLDIFMMQMTADLQAGVLVLANGDESSSLKLLYVFHVLWLNDHMCRSTVL